MDVVNHGLEIGNEITIRDGATPFDLFVNQKAIVTSTPTADQFTFNLGVENVSLGASLTASRQLAIGKGFIHMPAAPWGQFHQRRLWVPYWFTSDASPTDRNNRDEIVASDILDSDTYDRIGNQFRITAGKSDFLVGIQPFTQDTLAIFNRKSIHLMTGVSGSLADVKTNVVTTEIGASARKSIVQVAIRFCFFRIKEYILWPSWMNIICGVQAHLYRKPFNHSLTELIRTMLTCHVAYISILGIGLQFHWTQHLGGEMPPS